MSLLLVSGIESDSKSLQLKIVSNKNIVKMI